MRSLCLFLLRVYRVVSPPFKLTLGVQGCCRFTPTCSRYAEEAICEHGCLKGIGLAGRRLLRCHPWGGMGFDPVPPRRREASL